MARKPPCSAPKRPKPKPWSGNSAAKRIVTGQRLQRERERLWATSNGCAICGKFVALADWRRDHTVALAEGGKDEPGNTQGVCRWCHDAKSIEEAKRGRARGRGSRKSFR